MCLLVSGWEVLRPLAGNGGACEGSRCAYWCRVGRYCARLPAMEGPVRAPGVPTGFGLGGIAHGYRQWMGLGMHPVCLPVSG